jgi:hypothetical protein
VWESRSPPSLTPFYVVEDRALKFSGFQVFGL